MKHPPVDPSLTNGAEPTLAPARRRLLWTKAVLAVGMLAGLLLSHNLWLTERMYPHAPVADWLPAIPPPFDELVYVTLLVLCVAAAVLPRSGWLLWPFLALLGFVCLGDQTRWQPWVYQYALMLAAVALAERRAASGDTTEAALNTCRFIVAALYFWSGLQKANASFVDSVFPWLVKPFYEMAEGDPLRYFALAVPAIEAGLGLALLFRRTRPLGILFAIAMHAHIMLAIGPFGHDWNTVVWPWNFVMSALVVILFARTPELRAGTILAGGRRPFHVLAIVLFGVMPAVSFANWRWDAYLSSALYSGNTLRADLKLSREAVDKLPPEIRALAFRTWDGYYVELQTRTSWPITELNVPPNPARRIFMAVGQGVFRMVGQEKYDVVLEIGERPDWRTGKREKTYYDCSADGCEEFSPPGAEDMDW